MCAERLEREVPLDLKRRREDDALRATDPADVRALDLDAQDARGQAALGADDLLDSLARKGAVTLVTCLPSARRRGLARARDQQAARRARTEHQGAPSRHGMRAIGSRGWRLEAGEVVAHRRGIPAGDDGPNHVCT